MGRALALPSASRPPRPEHPILLAVDESSPKGTGSRAALASFFERVERLDALHRLLIDQNVGVNAAMESAKDVAGKIRDEMKRRCDSLLDEARRLVDELPE